jgi:hypothetical protein
LHERVGCRQVYGVIRFHGSIIGTTDTFLSEGGSLLGLTGV